MLLHRGGPRPRGFATMAYRYTYINVYTVGIYKYHATCLGIHHIYEEPDVVYTKPDINRLTLVSMLNSKPKSRAARPSHRSPQCFRLHTLQANTSLSRYKSRCIFLCRCLRALAIIISPYKTNLFRSVSW